MAYHLRHAGEWMIRLGDGTAESHGKAQAALDDLWPYVPELFEADDLDREAAASGFGVDPSTLRGDFDAALDDVLARADLRKPPSAMASAAGRAGSTANISATSWPRCRSCSGPIRTHAGDAGARPGARGTRPSRPRGLLRA